MEQVQLKQHQLLVKSKITIGGDDMIKSSVKRLRQDRLKIVQTVQEGERGESKGNVVGW